MSGEQPHPSPESGNHHGENGRTNPGFDDPLRNIMDNHDNISDTNYHNDGNQPTDWKKFADESFEYYLSGCPGGHGRNEQAANSQSYPSVNVCYLVICITSRGCEFFGSEFSRHPEGLKFLDLQRSECWRHQLCALTCLIFNFACK